MRVCFAATDLISVYIPRTRAISIAHFLCIAQGLHHYGRTQLTILGLSWRLWFFFFFPQFEIIRMNEKWLANTGPTGNSRYTDAVYVPLYKTNKTCRNAATRRVTQLVENLGSIWVFAGPNQRPSSEENATLDGRCKSGSTLQYKIGANCNFGALKL